MWTDESEVCGLKKKIGHWKSREFSLERKTRRLKTLLILTVEKRNRSFRKQ